MLSTSSLALTAPVAFWFAMLLAIGTASIVMLRRPAVPLLTHILVALGLPLLALAAGGLTWRRPAGDVVVMVDLSPSTRTARYRDAAALRERVRELLGDVPYRFEYFAADPPSRQQSDELNRAQTLNDLPAERTVYAPPVAAAVVLFSDGRFDAPASAPATFPVIDPLLESPPDASVEKLEIDGAQASITTRNSGPPRELSLSGIDGPASVTAPPGALILPRAIAPGKIGATVTARLNPGDPWPENDALTTYSPPPAQALQWWVTTETASGPPRGATWIVYRASDLPTEPAAYLAPSIIVLNNVAASDLSASQLQGLSQYVRDLGGGLVILGGDRAFAAGGYIGTTLESLSPLASTAPQPVANWVLLVDSSGSMNAPASGASTAATRWRVAAEAAAGLVRALPPNDRVSVGGFAANVTWWTRDRRAGDSVGDRLPPPAAAPSGPTELRRALEELTVAAAPALPTQLILLTDGNAELPDAARLSDAMRRRNVRLHLLAIGDGAGLPALRQLVEATGGTLLREVDSSRWAEAARHLLRRATADLLRRDPVRVQFLNDLRTLAARDVDVWNRTWLKVGATPMAETRADSGKTMAMAARWLAGEGTALAAAYSGTSPEELAAFLRITRRPPRDPRLRLTWSGGPSLRVTIDAFDRTAAANESGGSGAGYLNQLDLSLHLADAARLDAPASVTRIPQIAPGRYELSLNGPRSPALATIRLAGSAAPVDRFEVAGRYAAEFNAVGNDRPALRELATRTGGTVVEPSARGPLDLSRPRRDVPVTSPLAAAGAACVALGLVRWRRS